jgi:hypothetical protein
VADEDPGPGIWLESTRGPDDAPVCLFTFGTHQSYPPVADVRATALDLVTCAAYAEMMLELTVTVKIPPEVVGRFTTALLQAQDRQVFGTKATLTMLPAVTVPPHRKPYVLLKRGSRQAALTAGEARQMALAWLSVAEATESDQLVSDALDAIDVPDEIQAMLFAYLHVRRSDTPDVPQELPQTGSNRVRACSTLVGHAWGAGILAGPLADRTKGLPHENHATAPGGAAGGRDRAGPGGAVAGGQRGHRPGAGQEPSRAALRALHDHRG